MGENRFFSTRIKGLIGAIFTNSTIHPYVDLFLYIVWTLEIVGLFLTRNEIKGMKFEQISQSMIAFMVWTMLGIVLLTFGSVLVVIAYENGRSKKKVNKSPVEQFDVQSQEFWIRILKRILAISLILHRRVLTLPTLLTTLTLITLPTQAHLFPISIISLILVSIIYILSLSIYFNKLVIETNASGYPFVGNLELFLGLVGVGVVVVEVIGNDRVWLVNGVCVVVGVVVLWVRPIVSYRRGKVGLWGCVMVLGALAVETGRLFVMNDEIAKYGDEEQPPSITQIISYLITTIIIATVLYNIAQHRLKTILLFNPNPPHPSNPLNKLTHTINNLHYQQTLFYHLLNYHSHKQDLILWVLKIKEQLSQQPQSISQKECIVKKVDGMIEALKDNNEQAKIKLFQLALKVVLGRYEEGEVKQVKAFLVHQGHLHFILAQLLFLALQGNVFQCYERLKQHQRLCLSSGSSFFGDLFNELLVSELDQSFKQNIKLNSTYSLRAQRYFTFERVFQSLKSDALRVSELRQNFWRESTSKQPNCNRLQTLVKQSYALQQSVYAKTRRLSKLFTHDRSPIILYPFISSYSKLIMNKSITSKLSPYNCLHSQYQRQLEEFRREGWGRLDGERNGGSYGLLESIGVCVVDLEQDRGRVEWGNAGFWGEVYERSADNSSNGQSPNGTNQAPCPNINDLLIPNLRQSHNQWMTNLAYSPSQLSSMHSQKIFLFNQSSKILQPFQLRIQLYPSLLQSLRACCFFGQIPSNDTTSTFSLLIKESSWEVVGWTETFRDWRELLLGEEGSQDWTMVEGCRGVLGELRQAIQQIVAKRKGEMQSRDGDKDKLSQQAEAQLPYRPTTQQNKQKPLKVLIDYNMFVITLTHLYNSSGQSSQTLFQLQFSLLSQNCDPSSFSKKQTSTVINVTSQQVEIKSQSSNISSSMNSSNIFRGLGFMRSLEKSNEEFQTGNQDTDHVINDNATYGNNDNARKRKNILHDINKTYKTFTATKQTPKTIKAWTILTLATLTLLSTSIVSNICIFNHRQSIYQKSNLSIKYYNQLITDIAQLVIALRQYNYYAFFKGPQDQHIPLLIKQVNTEEEQVNFKLNQVKTYLNEKWEAMEVSHNNSFRYVLEEDYIVIADFMLSSMTYISEVPPQEMTFPIFWGDHPQGQDLTKTQVNFYEAVCNGIFVVLDNLNKRKAGFMNEVLEDFIGWQTKLYLYPCCAGLLIIALFVIISLVIEKRAKKVREGAVRMLSEVTFRQKRHKLEAIEQFRQINDFKQLKSSQSFKDDAMTHLQKTLSTLKISRKGTKSGGRILSEKICENNINSHNDMIKITENISKTGNPQTSRQTKRELFEDCTTIDEVFGGKEIEDSRDNQRVPVELPQKNRSILIYVIISVPTLAYLIAMLFGGLNMDDCMAQRLQMCSLIHSKKSNLQQVILLTRRTFYYESFINKDPQKWSDKSITFIQDVFWHNRKLQAMIDAEQKTNLNKLIKEINYRSLCSYLGQFPSSDYYSVKFTQEQCKNFTNGLFLNGIKPTEVFYLESSLNIFTQVKDPSLLTREQKYGYLRGQEIKTMKVNLAYLEIFMDMMKNAFEMDLEKEIGGFVGRVRVLSGLAFGVLFLLAIGIKLRASNIRKDRKFATQIVEMISLRMIKDCSRLKDVWGNIDFQFYE